jgi:hypothetical protein
MDNLALYVIDNIIPILIAGVVLVFYIDMGSDTKLAKLSFTVFKYIMYVVLFLMATYFLSILYIIYSAIN